MRLLTAGLLVGAVGCAAPGPEQQGGQYRPKSRQQSVYDQFEGYNPELSGASKRAVKLARPAIAENLYLGRYQREPGPMPLYQIFLVYIDQHNDARDLKKARFYLEKLNNEWPNSMEVGKAKKHFSKLPVQP